MKKILIVILTINIIILIGLLVYQPEKLQEVEKGENQAKIPEAVTQDMILTIDNFDMIAENYTGELVLLTLRIRLKELVDQVAEEIGMSYTKCEALEGSYIKNEPYDSFVLRVYSADQNYINYKVEFSNYEAVNPIVIFGKVGGE